MQLDLKTLALVLVLASLLQVIAFSVQIRSVRAKAGLGWWLLGNLCYTFGFTAVALREVPGLSTAMILANNLCFMTGNSLFYLGLRRFFGETLPWRRLGSALGAACLLILWFTLAQDVMLARRVVLSAYGAGIAFCAASMLWRHRLPSIRTSSTFLVTVFIFYGAMLLLRILEPFLEQTPDKSIFTPSPLETLTYLTALVSGILLNFGLITLINQQLHAENQASRRMLETILDTIPARVFWKDAGLHYRGGNRAFLEDTGLHDPSKLSGQDDFDLWPTLAIPFREADQRVMESGQPILGAEVCVSTPEGRQIWRRTNKVPLRGADGEIQGVLGTYEDITARKKAEAETRISQARLKAVFESAGAGISMTDAEGRYIECNPKWAEFLGYPREELLGRSYLDVTHPGDAGSTREHWTNLMAGQIGSYLLEKRYVRRDGRIVWGLVSVTPIRDEQGRPLNAIGVVVDITALKETEAALRQHTVRLQTILANLHGGVVIVGSAGQVELVNQTFCDFFGFPEGPEALVGLAVPALMERLAPLAIDPAASARRILQIRAGNVPVHDEEFQLKDGRCILRDFVPVVVDGSVVAHVWVHRDITGLKAAEDEQRRHKLRLQILLSSLHEGIVVLNQDGIVEFVNGFLCELFDLPERPEELIGLASWPFRERLNLKLADPEAYNARIEELLAEGKPSFDEEFLLRNGRIIRRDFVPIGMDGTMTGRMWVHRDITAIRKSEEKLAMEEQRLRGLMRLHEAGGQPEAALIRIAVEEMAKLSGSSLAYLHFVNPDQETLELAAWNEEALKACTASKDDHYPISQAGVWADCFRRRKPVIHNAYQELPGRHGYPAGHAHLERHMSVPIFDGSQVVAIAGVGNKPDPYQPEDAQQLTLFAGGMWNLLRRKRAEQRLVERETFLRTIADTLPGLVGYWTQDLRCTFANVKYQEWFGKSAEEMQGIQLQELLGEEQFHSIAPHVWKALEGEPQRFERTLVKVDGSLGHTWTHYIPDQAGDEVRGFFALVSDVTELKQAQFKLEALNVDLKERTRQAEAASRAKSEFLANMSHEIRTPMNAIMGLSHLALRTGLTAKQQEYMVQIQAASRNLLGILNDILDLSKVEADKLRIEQTAFDLRQVLDHVASLVAERVREKQLALTFDVSPGTPCALVGDPLRLGQILLNLVNNAVKFTSRGTVAVAVEPLPGEAGQARLLFSVRDTGIGIAPEVLPDLFQAFRQADTSTTRRFGGTGLGLTICKRLVELMGGEIHASSEPGVGSTFAFTLAFTLQAPGSRPAAPEPAPAPPPEAAPPLRRGRILLAEDNEVNRIVVQELLEGAGFEVAMAENGRQAVDLALAPGAAFDLILMDIQMPEMDGREAAARIRARNGTLPIIAITAHAMDSERAQSVEAGMNDHLSKPFEPQDLFRLLDRWLPGQAAAAAAPPDPGRIEALVRELEPLVRRRSLSARKPLAHLRTLLGQDARFLALAASLDRLDFKGASAALAGLIRSLGLTQDPS